MSLPLPNLDDRTFADLMEEARNLLVAHAPGLTNHNPSDPLITLTELFAYLTEILLYRVNAVTDANRQAFLRLLNGPEADVPATPAEIDAAVRRTLVELRSVDRAVTAADFENLALTCDRHKRVARARCVIDADLTLTDPVQRYRQPGHVSVAIVAFPDSDLSTLCTLIAAHLEPRRLLGTQVHVVGVRLVPVTIRAMLHVRPDTLTSMSNRATDALTAYFHPLTGRDGAGWPFGRAIFVSEIYRVLDGVAGVDYVSRALEPGTSDEVDELDVPSELQGRFVRNALGKLVGLQLEPDELVTVAADLTLAGRAP